MAPEAFSTEASKRWFETVSLVLLSVVLSAANTFAMHSTMVERRNILLAKLESMEARPHGQAVQGIYVLTTA